MSCFPLVALVCIGIFLPVCLSQSYTNRSTIASVLCEPIPICKKTKYRTYNGQCNNLHHPLYGAAQTTYLRLVPNNYADGKSKFPTDSSGEQLASARLVSLKLFPFKPIDDPTWNLNSMQFGQLVAHDMSFTALNPQSSRNPVVCCDSNFRPTANASRHPCIPIWIPKIDPAHPSDGKSCMNVVRTLADTELSCIKSKKTAEQINAVSAFLDLSVVYGSTGAEALRARVGGLLLTNEKLDREFPPQIANATRVCDIANSPDDPCFLTGDGRSNQSPELAIVQTLMHRDHNKIAHGLASINPHWDDERLFQESRRIAIAKYQHIVYYEWLPTFLGYKNLIKNKVIYANPKSHINDYDSKVNPAVSNEHATGSLRDPHTWIQGFLRKVNEARKSTGNDTRLSDHFNKPKIITEDGRFDDFIRGMTCQKRGGSDQYHDLETTKFLFKRNRTVGVDLRAIDIQRGRDHGLATYLKTRAWFKLSVPKKFSDLRTLISEKNIKILKSLYKLEDIDLSVGGALEKKVEGTAFGPTFLHITTNQFLRSRTGDRFFYENGADPRIAFKLGQLKEIRKSSMARLLCDNSDNIRKMQPKAFQLISENNKLVPCKSIPEVNLKLWKDKSKTRKRPEKKKRSLIHSRLSSKLSKLSSLLLGITNIS